MRGRYDGGDDRGSPDHQFRCSGHPAAVGGLRRRRRCGLTDRFFEQPVLNSPYEHPGRHWGLDDAGQPTQLIIEGRRLAAFISPIPKPKKQRSSIEQAVLVLDEGEGLSTEEQQYG